MHKRDPKFSIFHALNVIESFPFSCRQFSAQGSVFDVERDAEIDNTHDIWMQGMAGYM